MKIWTALAVILLSLALAINIVHAEHEIVELPTLSRLEQRVKDQSILIFDLHGTIAEARGEAGLGSDAWVDAMIKNGVDFDTICDLWGQLQRRIELAPVEELFPKQFRYLQTRFKILILTGGLISHVDRYVEQLTSIGIDLRQSKLSRTADFKLPTKNGQSKELVKMRDGLLAIGPNISKGDAIQSILVQLELRDHPIVVIDDRRDYLENIAATLSNIDLRLFHYTASALKASYQHDQAQAHLRKLIIEGAVKLRNDCELSF